MTTVGEVIQSIMIDNKELFEPLKNREHYAADSHERLLRSSTALLEQIGRENSLKFERGDHGSIDHFTDGIVAHLDKPLSKRAEMQWDMVVHHMAAARAKRLLSRL